MLAPQIRQLIVEAIGRAQEVGQLPPVALPEVVVERPPSEELGDYASSVALKMARSARMAPMQIAGAISANLRLPESISAVEVAPPGFLNFFLAPEWLQQQVDVVLEAGPSFGRVDVGGGRSVQVEYVSANPTGPLHIGAGRGAALGDTLANVLDMAGYRVQREYYINDAGSRMEAFYASVYARYAQQFGLDVPVPEDGYPGEYLVDVARVLAERYGRAYLDRPREEAQRELGREGMAIVLEGIRRDLDRMGVRFDNWYSEQSLYDRSLIQQTLDLLRARGHVVEREGAVWFTAAGLGEDRENVLVRSNGVPTYFLSDIAYHRDKFVTRGFDRVIDVWGADHQGHVPRMKAAVKALGIDPERLAIIIYQLVNLVREGRLVRMGKRTGAFVTLGEVLDEVGPDAVRYFMVARSPDAMMDFDLGLARERSEKNPVYYVQYAHARIASILRRASDVDYREGDVRLLAAPVERSLMKKMLQLPEVVEGVAANLAPHPLPYYAQELAGLFHVYYRDHRVLSEDVALTKARLKLVAAYKQVLATTLRLIGVSAPEVM
ncbi:MAG TPA: arginine--tRNA ligase [Chloroflexota bacterium]